MSDDVTVQFDDNPADQATLLLAAAEELDLGAGVVKTADGAFVVPEEVRDRAFKKDEPEPEPEPEPEKPQYKYPAKRATKKAATKKVE